MEKFTYQQMHQDEKEFWWYVARRKILKSVLLELNTNGQSVLEIGSGTGGNVELLSEFGGFFGVEKEPLAIEFAKSKHPDHNFKQLEVPEELSQILERYDLIAMFDVIEHIEDDLETMKEVKKLMNDHGRIVITTPAFPSLWSAHDAVHHHFRRYTRKELFKLIEKSGFNIEYHSFFNFFLFPVAVMVKVMNKISGINKPHKTKISKLLNLILEKMFSLEAKILPHLSLPFGVSHVVVLSKPEKQ